MKRIKVELQDVDGNVIEESSLVIEEGDRIILRFPEDIDYEQAIAAYRVFTEGIKNNKVIALYKDIEINILKIQ